MKGYFICYFKKLLFYVNILILILQMTLQEENLNHNLSEIILTIEGTGKQQILSNSFNILPTKVEGDCYLMNDNYNYNYYFYNNCCLYDYYIFHFFY